MIGLECKRRTISNQFNNILLNVQEKIDCNKINEIREERNTNSIYTGSATSRAYIQSSSNPLEISTNFVKKPFYNFETPKESISLMLSKLTT